MEVERSSAVAAANDSQMLSDTGHISLHVLRGPNDGPSRTTA